MSVPETDVGLPGTGPIHHDDWFRDLWHKRRTAWVTQAQNDQGSVVFVGDSITQGWGDDLGGSFAGLKVANRGIGGDTTRGVLIRLAQDVIALHPSAVVLLAGTNDIEEGADAASIAGNMSLILAALKEGQPRLPIVLCEVFPSSPSKKRPKERIVEVNQRYRSLAKGDPQVTLLETWALFADDSGNAKLAEFPDLLHPNDAGYKKWASALAPVLATVPKVDAGVSSR